jgi:DNA-binding transcriptional ArsR family regulator
MPEPTLHWDFGTAYDFFVSLTILHDPNRFSVRAAWAAGQRQRLPAADRDFLEEIYSLNLITPPLHWIYPLPSPKDGETVLWALEQIPPERRLAALGLRPDMSPDLRAAFNDITARGQAADADIDRVWGLMDHDSRLPMPSRRQLPAALGWWAQADEFGERLLRALRAYQDNFFEEEERRIEPILQQGSAEARMLAGHLPFERLLENLSQGVRFEVLPRAEEFALAPSYWGAPLVFHGRVGLDEYLLLFGARPFNASIVPGEVVPDALVNGLKALSDPTRLRILRYLSRGALTPTELADRLRLRTSTVAHHLNALRMAGLVFVMVGEGRERKYATRDEQLDSLVNGLHDFLASQDTE